MTRKNLIWCDDKTLSKDLKGKTYIVTGANSGVGLEVTRQLVKQGAHVIMACRRVDAGEQEAKSFVGLKGSYEVMKLDLADLNSIRIFAEEFIKKYDKLDGLDCNAGMVNMNNQAEYTKDGFEITWAASYFGHFLLTELLLDILKNTPDSRIVILSSVVHAGSPKNRHRIHLDDLHYKNRKFNNFSAYGEAKVANVLYAMELADRLKGTGTTSYSVHPGWARSNFGKGGNFLMKLLMSLFKPILPFVSDSSYESAQSSLHCLLSDDAQEYSGQYFSQSSVLYRDKECVDGGFPMKSPNPNARDMKMAKQLVKATYSLVNLK